MASLAGPFEPMPDLIAPSEHSAMAIPRTGAATAATVTTAAATAAAATTVATAAAAAATAARMTDESTRTVSEGVKNGSDNNNGGTDGRARCDEAEMSVSTETHLETHKINWRIDSRTLHIATLAPKGDKRGVIEANLAKKGHRFKLELCASGWRNSQDNYAAFYLTVADEGDLFVARYRVRVGEIQRISSIRHDFHLGVGFPNFCLQPALTELMDNDQVNFYVTVEVFSCSSDVRSPPRPPRLPVAQRSDEVLARMVRLLWNERQHSDVTLECRGGRKIRAHKSLLSAASPVFRSMFSHKMMESRTNSVRMHDWSVDCVRLLVWFVYHGELPGTRAILQQQSANLQPQSNNGDFMHNVQHFCSQAQAHPHPLMSDMDLITQCDDRYSGVQSAATKLLRSGDCLTPSPETSGSSAAAAAMVAASTEHRLDDCSLITGLDEDDDDDDDVDCDIAIGYGHGHSVEMDDDDDAHMTHANRDGFTAAAMLASAAMMIDRTVQADMDDSRGRMTAATDDGFTGSEEEETESGGGGELTSSSAADATTDEDVSMEACKKSGGSSRAQSLPPSIISTTTVLCAGVSADAGVASSFPSSSDERCNRGVGVSSCSLSKSQSPMSLIRMADGSRRVIRGNRHSPPVLRSASSSTSLATASSAKKPVSAAMMSEVTQQQRHCHSHPQSVSVATMMPSQQQCEKKQSHCYRNEQGKLLLMKKKNHLIRRKSSEMSTVMSSAGIYFDLFALAEYYEMEALVIACCERMFSNLTVDSACDLLIKIQIFSHVRSVAQIEESVWSFVTDHIHSVKRTDGYARMLRNHPALLERLIDRIT